MEWRRGAVFVGTALLGLASWIATTIIDDVYSKIRTLRDAHVRHLEYHVERSKEQPSVWRVR